ncbi:hypothetical protein [Synechococcus elongatus]|uniref:ParB/Sulfiredoxin domain-containing protein n=2 Tax=Synechococcus elongatus TaxID=32046 RepID=A0AAN1QPN3_SYNEL|nr:hypothetical protein [Synechococcus elongatus]AZB73220.1 hypothetical protein DOP62_11285 [Synechococcus elongatus PCC 11801]QFZ92374.1 hypothetical protein EKO22_08440 [Synechococcus elongatus PCC 11802]
MPILTAPTCWLPSEQEYERFRQSLPYPECDEQFRFYRRVWSVAKAKFLIAQGQVACLRNHIHVPAMARFEGIDYPHPEQPSPFRDKNRLAQGRSINDLRIDRALKGLEQFDLSRPLIVAQARQEHPETVLPVLIDGGHRLRYAFLSRISHLSAYLLTPEQTQWIELP